MNTYEYALEYIKMGFKVFPVHGIKEDGSCTCFSASACTTKGKHPVTKNGVKDATDSPNLVKTWFDNEKGWNIAIATGKESGLIVIDVDGDGWRSINESDITETLEQKTGSGGRHIIYKRPSDADKKYKTKTKVLHNVDSRADGGYIVAPPSRHASGGIYEWLDEELDTEIADCPDWFLNLIEEKKTETKKSALLKCNQMPENITELLDYIPSDDYDIWYKVGLALFRCSELDGFDYFDYWSNKSSKYNYEATWNKWKSFARSQEGDISIGTIHLLAKQHGYTDPLEQEGEELAGKFWNALQVRQAKRLAEVKSKKNVKEILKPNFIPKNPNNLIAKITKQIIDTSVYKQPDLAVAAAIGLIGALGGRRYATETDLRTNIYIVGLAESGSGKDWARKIIYKIAYDAGLDRFFGGDKIGSGQGLLASMQEHPMRYYLIDEFGYFMEGISSKNAGSHQKEILNVILQMYSSSNSIFRGTDYADRKTRERKDIIEPTLCIYGTSTHDSFYNSISSSKSIDGTLSRVLFVDAGLDRPKGVRRPQRYTTDDSIIKGLLSIVDSNMFNESGEVGGSKIGSTKIVSMTPDVDDLFYTLSEESYKLSDDSASRSIYSRVAENAIKLSLIYAIADNPENPMIGIDAYEWARDISFYSANLILREIRLRVSDNDQEKNTKKVLSFVKNSKNGITRTELIRKSFFLKRKELDEIIESLKEGGEIEVEIREGKKKPVIYYT